MLMEAIMTTQVEAIFQNGIFKPLEEVQLPDNQRVRLSVQSIEAVDTRNWLEEVQQMRQRIIAQRGYFPDSSHDIAEDRWR
jgi:predicted DNA-binding antitoxin AbrB/MazE fold protein